MYNDRVKVAEKEGTMKYTNVPAVHIKGVEGEVRYDWQGKLQLASNVSYQDARDQQKYKNGGKPSATYDNRVPNRPWLFGSAEAYYTFRNVALPESKLRLGCTYQWIHWYYLLWEAYGATEGKAAFFLFYNELLNNRYGQRMCYNQHILSRTWQIKRSALFPRLFYLNHLPPDMI